MEPNNFKIWVEASRPKTLTAAFTPVLVGASIAWHDGNFVIFHSFIALVCAFLIQIGTNFANDYYDFVKGADTDERIGLTGYRIWAYFPRANVKSHFYFHAISIFVWFISGMDWRVASTCDWPFFITIWCSLYRWAISFGI